ncbi:hypothetical protein F4804DRAFT_327855 [Jackrogersella minutella]|nr:hypothetical protein F4804DRAFT_327855 [Jackrogersella minutella]
MENHTFSTDTSAVTRMPFEDHASRFQYHPLSKSAIESALEEYFYEIRETIAVMANDILRLGLPTHQPVVAQWDLQRVLVDVTSALVKPHPCMTALQEAGDDFEFSRNIYTPVITIPLPWNVRETDKRVTFLKDALLYDETGEFGGLHGIPFRQHPKYGQFTLEFTNQFPDSGVSSRSLWCPSTAVYLPDPGTMFDEVPRKFMLHDTWDTPSLQDWASMCREARESHREQSRRSINKEGGIAYGGYL